MKQKPQIQDVLDVLQTFSADVDKRFNTVDTRLDRIDRHLNVVDERLNGLGKRFDTFVDFNQQEARLKRFKLELAKS